jgi:RNA polymerase sigma-70 factor (ECF subfamily)
MHRQFERTKQEFQHRLYSYAWYSLRIAADAEDIVQEAFLKLWENWQDIDPPQVGAWLTRVTQNLIIDHVRKQRTRQRVTDSEADLDQIAQEDAPDPQQQGTLKRIVEQSIARLNDPYRTILIMREIQGLSYQDIAAILCISVEHVKTDLFRGKRKLREIVRQHPLYHHDLLPG